MDVKPIALGDALLHSQSEMHHAFAPEDVRKPVSLNGLESLEVQERNQEVVDGAVSVWHRAEIAAGQPLHRAHLLFIGSERAVIHAHESFLPLTGRDSVTTEGIGDHV